MEITNQNLDAYTYIQHYTQELLGEMVCLQRRSIAESSQRQYKGTWEQWRKFCAHLGVKVVPAARSGNTITTTGYSLLVRRKSARQYLAVKGRRRIYTLQIRDVFLQDGLGLQTSSLHTAVSVEITLRGQMNDRQGHGAKRVLSRSCHRALCPVLEGRLLMENARKLPLRPEDPICSIKASTLLPAETMSKVLQAAAKATGDDATLFSCHSLRRGGATALLSAGVDSTAVMLHGRWKSDSYQRYTSYTNESGRHLAAQMTFGGSSTVQRAVPRQ